jgi:hypothetical protein
MACSLTRAEVSERILIVLRTVHRDNTISEETTFGRDLDGDDLAKEVGKRLHSHESKAWRGRRAAVRQNDASGAVSMAPLSWA